MAVQLCLCHVLHADSRVLLLEHGQFFKGAKTFATLVFSSFPSTNLGDVAINAQKEMTVFLGRYTSG